MRLIRKFPLLLKKLRQLDNFIMSFSNQSGSISRREIKRTFRDLDIRASDDEIEVIINQMDTDSKDFE